MAVVRPPAGWPVRTPPRTRRRWPPRSDAARAARPVARASATAGSVRDDGKARRDGGGIIADEDMLPVPEREAGGARRGTETAAARASAACSDPRPGPHGTHIGVRRPQIGPQVGDGAGDLDVRTSQCLHGRRGVSAGDDDAGRATFRCSSGSTSWTRKRAASTFGG